MESTAFTTIAKYRGVKLAVIASVSDELRHDGTWIRGFNTRKLSLTENLIVKVALNAITELKFT